jgi:hypothetical protein
MVLLIERHTHVEYDVWVTHLVHNFNLLDKVNDGLLRNTLSTEPFDRDWRSHPNGLENFTIAPTTEKICFVIELKIIKINVETEAVLIEGLHQVLISILVKILGLGAPFLPVVGLIILVLALVHV